jgi:hypothetical protein
MIMQWHEPGYSSLPVASNLPRKFHTRVATNHSLGSRSNYVATRVYLCVDLSSHT